MGGLRGAVAHLEDKVLVRHGDIDRWTNVLDRLVVLGVVALLVIVILA
jgi:hypothetical protein